MESSKITRFRSSKAFDTVTLALSIALPAFSLFSLTVPLSLTVTFKSLFSSQESRVAVRKKRSVSFCVVEFCFNYSNTIVSLLKALLYK